MAILVEISLVQLVTIVLWGWETGLPEARSQVLCWQRALKQPRASIQRAARVAAAATTHLD